MHPCHATWTTFEYRGHGIKAHIHVLCTAILLHVYELIFTDHTTTILTNSTYSTSTMDQATLQQMQEALKAVAATNVTRTVHQKAYPAISPTRPELNQAGRVVIITGGGTGIGLSIAQSFVRASADTIIIIGRREAVLKTAVTQLEAIAKEASTGTKILARTCDLVKTENIEALWKDLADQNIVVDVFINNAAKFTELQTLSQLGADEIWSQIDANFKGPLYFSDKFCAQKTDKQRVTSPHILSETSADAE